MKEIIEKLRENGIQMCIEPDPDSSIVTITFVSMGERISSSHSVCMSMLNEFEQAIDWFINIQLDNFIRRLNSQIREES